MKISVLLIVFFALTACSQSSDKKNIDDTVITENIGNIGILDRITYVNNPKSSDTLCLFEIKRAKTDVKNNKIVLTHKYGFGTRKLRYESELKALCQKYKMEFEYDMISDVVNIEETQGCYGDYMDKIIIEKFGSHFRDNLFVQADSIFLTSTILNNKIVQYWDCDERARLPNENRRINDDIPSINVSTFQVVKDTAKYGGWPFFDLGFIVEKDSSINGFYIRNFVPHLTVNERSKEKLFPIAVKYMNENYPVWVPGMINKQSVRTDNNVRLFFSSE